MAGCVAKRSLIMGAWNPLGKKTEEILAKQFRLESLRVYKTGVE
jgi:hypothetical protein